MGSKREDQRDKFSEPVRKIVAERAAYRCSRPQCRVLTIGPHSNPGKSASTGVAAHICAARPNGPRYDPDQSEDERRSISNAIWLCHKCSDLVDKDPKRFPKDELLRWKTEHEKFIAEGGGYPPLPQVNLQTLHGLTLPNRGPAMVTGKDVESCRQHILTIRNEAAQHLEQLRCRLQFPEPILRHVVEESPVGSTVECKPDRMQFVTRASGGGSVSVSAGERPALDYIVSVDKLPTKHRFAISFVSLPPEPCMSYGLATGKSAVVEHYLKGRFLYNILGESLMREFIVPFVYDAKRRVLTASPGEEQAEALMKYQLVRRSSW